LIDLFSNESWSELSTSNKQIIGKRLRKYVERGDFINISVKGKGCGNQIIYNKTQHNKVMTRPLHEIELSEPEIILLRFIEHEGVLGHQTI
jgi:hypothetical protein